MKKKLVSPLDNEEEKYYEAWQVCRALHGDAKFSLKILRREPGTAKVVECRSTHGHFDKHRALFKIWQKKGWEPFVVVAETDGEGAARTNIVGARAIAVDLDKETNIDALEALPFKPTFAVETSEGRYHLCYVLTESVKPGEQQQLLDVMTDRLNGDPCFANIAQAIRLPGFVNRKHGADATLVIAPDDGRRYSVSHLEAMFDKRLVIAFHCSAQPRFTPALRLPEKACSAEQALSDVTSALDFISADDYDDWIRVGMALRKLEDDGFSVWEKWSATSKKYRSAELKAKWKSFEPVSDGRSVSLKSIFFRAANAGWKNPGYRHEPGEKNTEQPTERVLGRRIARQMGADYAASVVRAGSREALRLHEWDGRRYVVLDNIARRERVERYCRALFANEMNADGERLLAAKAGNNRLLDTLSEHVTEFLLQDSVPRDANGFPYLSVANGVLNLLTQELVPERLRPIAYMSSPVIYDRNAEAPLFKQALADIFEGDHSMVSFVLRVFGYIMLGQPKEHVFVVFFGPTGRNGKSLLVEVFRAVLGDYACAVPISTFMTKSHVTDSATPTLARIMKKRLVVASEPNRKHQLDAGLIKQLTGGEHVSSRALYGEDVEALPEFVPLMVTNVLPEVREDDDALWRRMQIVTFSRTFSEKEIDPNLKEKLLREKSGILNVLLGGVRDYLQDGLRPPERVRSAVGEQRRLADPLQEWFEECVMENPGAETPLRVLWPSYEAFHKENSHLRRLTKREFSKKLELRGYAKQDRRNYPCYSGIALKQ